MKTANLARRRPVGFVFVLTAVWIVLLLVFMMVPATIWQKPVGDAMTVSIGRLVVTAGVLFLAWRLDWLKASVIIRTAVTRSQSLPLARTPAYSRRKQRGMSGGSKETL